MSPVIVIATHGQERMKITGANIKSLFPYTVVLVITDINEREYYEGFENVIIVMAANNPLGLKWDAGVQAARNLPHSHIVITGSDDILSKTHIKYATIIDKDFMGLRSWYILHENKLHLLLYVAKGNLPLGGGRVYSKSFLEKIDYKIFDTGKEKLLDDLGWEKAKQGDYYLSLTPELLAVKGNWSVMNKVDLNHKNVKLLHTYENDEMNKILIEQFGYIK